MPAHRLIFLIPILIFACKGKQSEQTTQGERDSAEVRSPVSQDSERDFLVDSTQNIWQRRDRFQIKLPKGYFIHSAIIMSNDSLKVGEIALDNQQLTTPMTNKELFKAINDYSTIKTTETNYGYPFPIKPEEVEKRVVLDSTNTHPVRWYYSISEMEWESVNDGVLGTCFHSILFKRIESLS